MVKENWPRLGVGAVLLDNKRLLLVKRAGAPAKGLWAIPGGKVKPGEFLHSAVIREIKEETGLDIEPGEQAHLFEVVERSVDQSVRYHYVIIDYFARITGGTLQPADDASDAAWFSIEDFNNPRIHEETRKLMKLLLQRREI